jgi:hypothetical protein
MFEFPQKDPNSKLDYKFDWAPLANGSGITNWLAPGETIVSYELTIPEGITKESDSLTDDNTSVTLWLSGGTNLEDYSIECKITTQTRIDIRTAILPVRNR